MYPKLFTIGHITFYTYGLFVALGFFFGLQLSLRMAKYRSITKDFMNYILVGAIIMGLVGARIAYVLISMPEYLDSPVRIFAFWEGGLVFWGGFIGAGIWVAFSCSKYGFNIWSTADVLAPGIALGHSLGRIGCFFAGCCYGKPTDSVLGIKFTHIDSLARPLGIPLEPTQLYSSAYLFILAGILYLRLKSERSRPYSVFSIYLLSYSTFRILIEFLRGDYRGKVVAGFTPTQWIAFLGVILGAILFSASYRYKK